MEYRIGTEVFGGWKIVKVLGEGASGRVYELQKDDFHITTKSALKVIRVPHSRSDIDNVMSEGMDEQSVTTYFQGFVDEIVKEIAIMSELKSHPNIVRYEDHTVKRHENSIGWDILIRMELLTPIVEYQKYQTMNEERVLQMAKELTAVLAYCHSKKLIHRDVKPQNVFVDSLGKFKLGDFGVARTVEKTTGGLSKKGTESFMAPEVYLGKPYGANVDLYSLGLMLYQYLNHNRMPFFPLDRAIAFSDREMAISKRMRGEEIPEPTDASEAFAKVILKACAFLQKDRYQSAQEMLVDLEKVSLGAGGYTDSGFYSAYESGMGHGYEGEEETIGTAGSYVDEEETVGMDSGYVDEEETVGMDGGYANEEETVGMDGGYANEEETVGMKGGSTGQKRQTKQDKSSTQKNKWNNQNNQNNRSNQKQTGEDKKSEGSVTISMIESVKGCEKRLRIDGKEIDLMIPAGIEDGMKLKIQLNDKAGAMPKEKLIEIHVKNEGIFSRLGLDLYSSFAISQELADAGGTITVPTAYGPCSSKVNPGSKTGTRIRFQGKGVPSLKNKNQYGDHYVTLTVIPSQGKKQTQKATKVNSGKKTKKSGLTGAFIWYTLFAFCFLLFIPENVGWITREAPYYNSDYMIPKAMMELAMSITFLVGWGMFIAFRKGKYKKITGMSVIASCIIVVVLTICEELFRMKCQVGLPQDMFGYICAGLLLLIFLYIIRAIVRNLRSEER
ncbi:MAG: protein kinase [Hespellia sp.]|nr:protein kinase [Hespellia sp.]